MVWQDWQCIDTGKPPKGKYLCVLYVGITTNGIPRRHIIFNRNASLQATIRMIVYHIGLWWEI